MNTVFLDRARGHREIVELETAEEQIRMLAQPRAWFVVVGAGHVVGPEGLLEWLRKQGYTVRQLLRES